MPQVSRVQTISDGVANPIRSPVHVVAKLLQMGTLDATYADLAMAGSTAGNITMVLPLREADQLGVSVQPLEVLVAAVADPDALSFTHRDAAVEVQLQSRPTSAVTIDMILSTAAGEPGGYLMSRGSLQATI